MPAKKKPVVPPSQMFHMGELKFIKKEAEMFLLLMSELNSDDVDGVDEFVSDVKNQLDEKVLDIGKRLGLRCYEEIMTIMLMFIDMHNCGKKVGVGVPRSEYELWKSHQRDIDEYDRSNFQRNHPYAMIYAECYSVVISKIKSIIRFYSIDSTDAVCTTKVVIIYDTDTEKFSIIIDSTDAVCRRRTIVIIFIIRQ